MLPPALPQGGEGTGDCGASYVRLPLRPRAPRTFAPDAGLRCA